jgi:DNA-binding transcriptional MerR regulator
MAANDDKSTQGLRSGPHGRLSAAEVARLFDLPEGKLRYWSQTGFLSPSSREGGRALYTFRDLIAVKVAKELLEAGLPLQRVRKSLDTLRASLPELDEPLARLRVRCEDDRVIVEDRERRFEAATGQLLLDLDVSRLKDRVAQVLRLPWVDDDGDRMHTAFEWFLAGCQRERSAEPGPTREVALGAARDAYEKALELDPQLAAAWTNLGGMLAETGDLDGARDHFARALECDPDQPEARANLAELALRQGDVDVAISGFRGVLQGAPDHFEAHYGLARALLQVGGKAQALAHLERFCAAVEGLSSEEQKGGVARRHQAAKRLATALRDELAKR